LVPIPGVPGVPGDILMSTLHNVYFVQYICRATEQAKTYLRIWVLVSHVTYICPCLFECAKNTLLHIFVIFKLKIRLYNNSCNCCMHFKEFYPAWTRKCLLGCKLVCKNMCTMSTQRASHISHFHIPALNIFLQIFLVFLFHTSSFTCCYLQDVFQSHVSWG